jgi:hypothetical protein
MVSAKDAKSAKEKRQEHPLLVVDSSPSGFEPTSMSAISLVCEDGSKAGRSSASMHYRMALPFHPATPLRQRSPTGWAPTGSVHRFRGSAPRIKSGAGSAREALSPVRSSAGRLPHERLCASPPCGRRPYLLLWEPTCERRPYLLLWEPHCERRPYLFLWERACARSFRDVVRRQAGSHRSTGSHRRATQLLHG